MCVRSKIRYTNPSAQINTQPRRVNDQGVVVETIFLDEGVEDEEHLAGEETYDSDVDQTKGAVYNNSTMSSEYSVNIQDFLSPDHRHSPRRGASQPEPLEDDDELIVMDSAPSTMSYSAYGSPADGRVDLVGQKSPGRSPPARLFEVRSASAQGFSSFSNNTDAKQKAKKSSPSRSLFDPSKNDEGPIQSTPVYSSPHKRDRSAGERKPHVGVGQEGVSPSPRREQIRRVVLELDDLEL